MIASLIGFAANFIPDIISMAKRHQDHSQELALLKAQADNQERLGAMRLEEASIVGSISASRSAHRHDASFKDVSRWVNNIRALMRPVLTLLVLGITGWSFAFTILPQTSPEIFAMIMTLTEVAFGFWFGGRVRRK